MISFQISEQSGRPNYEHHVHESVVREFDRFQVAAGSKVVLMGLPLIG